MMANTNAVTLSVALLLSLFFLLSNAVDVDSTSITTAQVKEEMTAIDSESTGDVSTISEEEGNTKDRVAFRPAVESISAVDPDLISHSFRIPFHRRAGRPGCRHGHADGFIRLPSGHAHRHVHRGEGFGFDPDHKRMQEEKEEGKKEFDLEELEHKGMRMRREDEDDEDDHEKMEEFEHKRKKMMGFNNGKAEEHRHEYEHEHDDDEDDDDEKEEWKKFGHKRMRRFRKELERGRRVHGQS